MTPGPTNNAGHRQLATVGKTLEPRLPEAGHHAEVYISQVGTVTGYCGLSPVLFPAGAPLIPSLVHVGQGRKWVVSTAPVGGCTDGLCLWGLHGLCWGWHGLCWGWHGLCWHVLFTEEEPGGYLHGHSLVFQQPLLLHLDVTSSPYPCLSWAAFLQHSTALSLRKFKEY